MKSLWQEFHDRMGAGWRPGWCEPSLHDRMWWQLGAPATRAVMTVSFPLQVEVLL